MSLSLQVTWEESQEPTSGIFVSQSQLHGYLKIPVADINETERTDNFIKGETPTH